MRWLVMPAVGSCQLLPVLSPGFTGPVAISAPVGPGPLARNHANDVRTIPNALNHVPLAGADLCGSYTRFNTVNMNPELFNNDTGDEFALDRHNPRIALTQPQGFFEEGREDEDTHRRLDRIHLGLGFFAPSVGAEFAAFIILHELSHFVGRANRQNIGDVGRGWFDDRFMRPLSANQRLSNADRYPGFGHKCRTGSAANPPFA